VIEPGRLDQPLLGEYSPPPYPGPRRRGRVPSWFITLTFAGIIVWWGVGLQGFMLGVIALPCLLGLLLMHRRAGIPRGFLLWLAFLAWCFVSLTKLQLDLTHIGAWLWRLGEYTGATLLFLYIYRSDRESLTDGKVVKAVAWLFVMVTIGGIVASVIPPLRFTTIVGKLLPQSIVSNGFMKSLVVPETSSARSYAGVHRPIIPLNFTNQWGSTYAVALPFAIASLTYIRSILWKRVMAGIMVLSIAPLIFSQNRGAWLSVGGFILYAAFRLAVAPGRVGRTGRLIIFGVAVAAVVVFLTPLYTVLSYRANAPLETSRTLLASETFSVLKQNPIIGYGAPFTTPTLAGTPFQVGGNGQLWELLVSQGIPGFLFYTGFFLYVLARTLRRPRKSGGRGAMTRFWCHCSILIGLAQFPAYELLPWSLGVMMVAAALALRELPYERDASRRVAMRRFRPYGSAQPLGVPAA
jgi:polysaccharide biosynthesis protein PslJ